MVNFKPVMLFLKIISLFIVQRNFGNIIYDYVQKVWYIEQLRKYEELKIKIKKAESDVTLFKNFQTFNVTPKLVVYRVGGGRGGGEVKNRERSKFHHLKILGY